MSGATPNRRFPVAVSVFRAIGIDRAIGFTVIGKVWLSVAGIVSAVAVGHWLSPDEQGYYYTFASMLTLQVFVELGLTTVILQFASHERAHLEFTVGGTLEGPLRAKSRLASLLRLAMRWYGLAAVLFAVALVLVGFAFFDRFGESESQIAWRLPWVWTVVATAGILLVSPMMAFLQGCGLVAEVARFRVLQAVAANVALWSALAVGAGLAAAAAFATTNLVGAVLWLAAYRRTLILDLLRAGGQETIKWGREVWPYQWRIAVSWLCGYFIFQLFTPLLFAFHGAAEAGRMGMALSIVSAIAAIGTSWLSTKAPRFGMLVAHRQFDDLDRLFFRSLKQATSVAVLAACSLLALIAALRAGGYPLADRVLDLTPLGILAVATLVNVVVAGEAVYLRAFKREPFMPLSVLSAILMVSSLWYFARFFGVTEMVTGYLVINLVVGLGLGTWIFCRKRRMWREEFVACV